MVPERAAVLLPRGVSVEAGAVATDACMTAHHAVVDRANVKKGDTVLIVGLGGLGFNALQIALSKGARVVVIDKRQEVLDAAEQIGVPKGDIVPAATISPSEWIRDQAMEIDTAIDFCGMKQTFETAVTSGRVISFSFLPLFPPGRKFSWSSSADLEFSHSSSQIWDSSCRRPSRS